MAASTPRSQVARGINEEIGLSSIPNLSSLYRRGELAPASVAVERPNIKHNLRVSFLRYDITKLRVDAIVNAANRELGGGSGVNGAIRAAAGDQMRVACELIGGCATGGAEVTEAYNLPCRRVFHAVGPRYGRDANPRELLQNCYKTVLDLSVAQRCKNVAFSCLSTGVYGYPTEEAAIVAIETVRAFLDSVAPDRLARVIFCCFEERDEAAYRKFLPKYFPPTQQERSQHAAYENMTDELAAVTVARPRTPRDRDGGSRSGTTPRESRRDRDGGSSVGSYEGRPSDSNRRYAQQGSYEGSGRSEPSRAPSGRGSQARSSELPTRSRTPRSPRRADPGQQYAYAAADPQSQLSSGRTSATPGPVLSAFDAFAGHTSLRAPGQRGSYTGAGGSNDGGRPPRQSSASRRGAGANPTPIRGGIPETSENEYSGTATPKEGSPPRNVARQRPEEPDAITVAAEATYGVTRRDEPGATSGQPRRDEASDPPEGGKPRKRFSLPSLCGGSGGGCFQEPVNYAQQPERMEAAQHGQTPQQQKSGKKGKGKPKKKQGFYFQGF